MKRIKSINGYTIYQASARDVSKYNVEEGYFYLYFSSDIRDYGLSCCEWDLEAGSIEEAEAFATGTNYAIAKEIVEETTTAASTAATRGTFKCMIIIYIRYGKSLLSLYLLSFFTLYIYFTS